MRNYCLVACVIVACYSYVMCDYFYFVVSIMGPFLTAMKVVWKMQKEDD